jgi:translation initiation factor 1
MAPARSSRLVYSTESGRHCPDCGQPQSCCSCRSPASSAAAGDGVVRVSRLRQGRGGKTVTLVQGLRASSEQLQQLGKQLRTTCGSGGTVKNGLIEIQGDHVARVMATLEQLGLRVKRAGG